MSAPLGLGRLRALALAATPGPWGVLIDEGFNFIAVAEEGSKPRTITNEIGRDDDAAYLASVDPQTVLALLDRVEGLETALRLFVAQWNACGPNSDFGRYFSNVIRAARDALKDPQ
jgi:hypothetical protein